jgi:hypothetical protein
MTLHLRPQTQAKLAAIAAAHSLSADDYVEALVERELIIESSETFRTGPVRPVPVWAYKVQIRSTLLSASLAEPGVLTASIRGPRRTKLKLTSTDDWRRGR